MTMKGLELRDNPDHRFKFNGKERTEVFGWNMDDFGARHLDPAKGRWDVSDPLSQKYYSISNYAFVANNPINAIDPDGARIFFVNGHYQDNWVGTNIIGSNAPGSAYWGNGFATAAQKFFNDYSTISNSNYIDGSSRIGIDMSGQDRYSSGYQYGMDNVNALTQNLASGETFKFVTHSEGSAYGAGIAQYLIDQGYNVESVAHLSVDEGNEFLTPTQPKTYQLGYKGDWVTGNHTIKGVDKSGIVDSGLGWLYTHGSTRNKQVFKELLDLKLFEFQENIGIIDGQLNSWNSRLPGSTFYGTDFWRVNETTIFNHDGTEK